ncbi:MAG: 3-deoxy-7-phosphoheptulonate synthase, partial [Ruthenibacterium sp.]
MIIIFKENATPKQISTLSGEFEAKGFKIHHSEGEQTKLIGLIGDTSTIDIDLVAANEAVADVKRVSEPYKKANRKFHPENTV